MTIYILGDSSTQFIASELNQQLKINEIDIKVLQSEYNQLSMQIFDENSNYNFSKPEYTIIYMTSEKLLERFNNLPNSEKSKFSKVIIEEIFELWNNIDGKIIQFNFLEIEQKLFGNSSSKTPHSFEYQIRKLNVLLSDLANQNGQYIVDLSSLQNRYGRENFFNLSQYYLGKFTISTKYTEMVCKMIADIIISEQKRTIKCVILDLDNTLWGGIIGDDGINHIQIGEYGVGKVFSDFQKYFKELKKRGIILCICSKNNESIAKEPFEHHPDMVLRLDDISLFIANWNDKATNIHHIKDTLNISYDSMIFIDDNPVERDLVRSFLPEVTVPELPKSPHKYLKSIIEQNFFESTSISTFDENRTKMYQQEKLRKNNMQNFSNMNDYMKNLSMECLIKEADDFLIPRISQLTQRSNQFNLRTQRYTENQIQQMICSGYKVFAYSLKDKFGDYGIIAVVILKLDDEYAFIDTFLMSCRVLERKVEHFIMNNIVQYCIDLDLKNIHAEYIESKKNAQVKHLYSKFGFESLNENVYKLNLNTYEKFDHYIRGV